MSEAVEAPSTSSCPVEALRNQVMALCEEGEKLEAEILQLRDGCQRDALRDRFEQIADLREAIVEKVQWVTPLSPEGFIFSVCAMASTMEVVSQGRQDSDVRAFKRLAWGLVSGIAKVEGRALEELGVMRYILEPLTCPVLCEQAR